MRLLEKIKTALCARKEEENKGQKRKARAIQGELSDQAFDQYF